MFTGKLSRLFAVTICGLALFTLTIGPAYAQHHPSWNQSFGRDSRSVDHQKTAMTMSRMMPGVGEWYNRNYEGGFPWAECILGYICCFIGLSSVMDASDGVDNDQWRFNFWVSPHAAYTEAG